MIRTFGVGKQTVLLLANVPAGSAIINTSTDQLAVVWLASDPNVQANIGFPLNALSSMEMAKTGPLYAVLDPGTTASVVTVLVGDDLNGYDNPIALASAVAAALAVTGIPNVLVEDVIATNTLLPTLTPKTFDVRKYGSVMIVGRDQQLPVLYEFLNDAGQIIDRDIFVPIVGGTPTPIRLAVTAPLLRLTNFTALGTDMHVDILASNRTALERFDVRSLSAGVALWTGPVPAAGNDSLLTLNDNARQHQGYCYANFSISSTTGTGYFFAQDVTALAAGFVILCDTVEMAAASSTAGKFISKFIAMPPGALIWYHCSTNTGGAVAVRMTPALLS